MNEPKSPADYPANIFVSGLEPRTSKQQLLETIEQAFLEVQHAQEAGPAWYTRGESGLRSQVAMWVRKGREAITELRATVEPETEQTFYLDGLSIEQWREHAKEGWRQAADLRAVPPPVRGVLSGELIQAIEQVRRAHKSAKPKAPENPSWFHAENDIGFLLDCIDKLTSTTQPPTAEPAAWVSSINPKLVTADHVEASTWQNPLPLYRAVQPPRVGTGKLCAIHMQAGQEGCPACESSGLYTSTLTKSE